MKRFIAVLLMLMFTSTAQADWRWAKPTFHPRVYNSACKTRACFLGTRRKAYLRYKFKVKTYHKHRLQEWKYWTAKPIPNCTWYGESGTGPRYAKDRYTMPNSGGSGAYGKFQFMPQTYFSVGKYDDWSALDQEIAARREYWRHGLNPWANC